MVEDDVDMREHTRNAAETRRGAAAEKNTSQAARAALAGQPARKQGASLALMPAPPAISDVTRELLASRAAEYKARITWDSLDDEFRNTAVLPVPHGIDSPFLRFLCNQNSTTRRKAGEPPSEWKNVSTFLGLTSERLEGGDGHWISFVLPTDHRSSFTKAAPVTQEEVAVVNRTWAMKVRCLAVAQVFLEHFGLAFNPNNASFTIESRPLFVDRIGTVGNHNQRRMTRMLRFMKIYHEHYAIELLNFLSAHIRGDNPDGCLNVTEETIWHWADAVTVDVNWPK